MANSFNLNRLTHTRDDTCGLESFYAQSVGPGNYQTTNLVPRASGVNPLSVGQLNIYLMKERVDLRRPLDTIPTKIGRWERFGSDSVFSDTLLTRRRVLRSYRTQPARGEGAVSVAGEGVGAVELAARAGNSGV